MPRTSQRAANITFGVIALVASIAVSVFINKSIWSDEGASLYSAHLSWSALWQESRSIDRVFLPYYALLHLWLLVGHSLQWARCLSLIAYALTVFFSARLALRLAGLWCGVVAAVLCAANPLMVQEALDARPYALTALSATLSVIFLVRWLDTAAPRWIWLFTVAAIATLALQLFAVLAPLAALAGVGAVRARWILARWRSAVVPVGLFLVVGVGFAAVTVGQRSQVGWIHRLTGTYLLNALNGPAAGSSFSGRAAYTLVVIFVLAAAVVVFARSWSRLKVSLPRTDAERAVILVAWAALPTIALIVVSFAKSVYVSRYVTASAPGLAVVTALFAVKAFELCPQMGRTVLRAARATLAILALLLIFGALVSARYKVENLKGAAQYLTEHVGTSGEVAYPNPVVAEEFDIYLGSTRVSQWPRQPDALLYWTLDLRASPSVLASGQRNVWVVLGTDSGRFIKDLKRSRYSRVGGVEFPGEMRVYLEHFQR